MQMHKVETNAGNAISCAPSRMASSSGLPVSHVAMDVFDRHRGVVHQNADRQRQAAERHQVDGFTQRAQGRQWSKARRAESTAR